jgi:hypothetical protein
MGIGRFFRDNDQPVTWYQHALIAIVLPALIALISGTGVEGAAVTAWLVLAYFVLREEGDEVSHKTDGDWHTPDARSVTPVVDKSGDLVGPVTATITYTLAWILS